MSAPNDPNELPLFRDSSVVDPSPQIPAWRPTPADEWARNPPSPRALQSHYRDLLRRNLEVLQALAKVEVPIDSPAVEGFWDVHRELVEHFVRMRQTDPELAASDAARVVPDRTHELVRLRARILEALEPDRRRATLKAEARASIPDRVLEEELAPRRLQPDEEDDDEGETADSAPWDDLAPVLPSGLIVDPSAVASAVMSGWKSEQDRLPLPAQGRLSTLLSETPVIWLDAAWAALELGADPPRRRKERERHIARYLADRDTLRRIVETKLSADERRLLGVLMDQGGKALATAVTRRFGNDDGDGWFWNETPPTSTLGRLRLRGLAFVGVDPTASRPAKTVLVPRELHTHLKELVAPYRSDADGPDPDPDEDLRPDIRDALSKAFPNGVVELPEDDAWLDESFEGLSEALFQLRGAWLHYERDPWGAWRTAFDDALEDSVEWVDPHEGEPDASYALFFIAPEGDEFSVPFENEPLDETDPMDSDAGVIRVGYTVAVSALAPFALVRLGGMESVGTSIAIPDIHPRFIEVDGERRREDVALLDSIRAEAKAVLTQLRDGIVQTLERFDVMLLPDEEAEKPVPWLERGRVMGIGSGPGVPVTVMDALFFYIPPRIPATVAD